MMEEKSAAETAVYEFRIKGLLDARRSHWFEGMTMTTHPDKGETILSGEVIDQAALHGLLNKIRDLGVPLLALSKLKEKTDEDFYINRWHTR